jgi:diacylglycerol kinase family enzyme
MRVVVLCNSISGRGKGRQAVEKLLQELGGAGHEVTSLDVNRNTSRDEHLLAALRGAGALIVAGGDGTIHHAAPLAIEAGVPLLHFPLGTENLFAREFGHRPESASAIAAINLAKPLRVDIGVCGTRPFMLMASVGFDAFVVQRLAAARTGAISRLTYARHIIAEFLQARFIALTVCIDGRERVRERPGMVVIANSRQYAGRLDPARRASMTDGRLDIVFLPIRSRSDIIRRSLQVMLGNHLNDPSVVYASGTEVMLRPATEAPIQLDGEYFGILPGQTDVPFSLRTGALNVLTG